jgi:hypothetical protein
VFYDAIAYKTTLNEHQQILHDTPDQKLVRQAFMGFCASIISDTISNLSLSIFAENPQIVQDQAYAELLQSQEASLTASQQYAQRLAAEELQVRLDGELARMLLDQDENGTDTHDIYR